MSLNSRHFEYVRTLLYEAAAIHLTDSKKYLVQSRLSPIARRNGFSTVGAMVDHMQRSFAPKLRSALIDAMTTHETYFFRDGHPFAALRKDVLPSIINGLPSGRGLKIWSAACSSGQEPYSLAMILDSMARLRGGRGWNMVATDIAEETIVKARKGLYSTMEMGRGLPPEFRRCFRKNGKDWEVIPELRRNIRFRAHCLVRHQPPGHGFDLILLRNVLIYFDTATKRQILDRAMRSLAPGGMLMLGSSESPYGLADGLEELCFGKCRLYRVKASAAAKLRPATSYRSTGVGKAPKVLAGRNARGSKPAPRPAGPSVVERMAAIAGRENGRRGLAALSKANPRPQPPATRSGRPPARGWQDRQDSGQTNNTVRRSALASRTARP